ncbi:MAG: PaaI family thioesterase [Stellaceae bacterium]
MVPTAFDSFPMPPCSTLLGWRLLDARPEEGWIRIGFDGKPEFRNPAGFIQGGLLSAMLDDTMGPAVFVKTKGRLYTATITMAVSFLAPAKVGPIIGEASVVQLGKTIAFIGGKLMDETGCLLATATATARRGWWKRQRPSGRR